MDEPPTSRPANKGIEDIEADVNAKKTSRKDAKTQTRFLGTFGGFARGLEGCLFGKVGAFAIQANTFKRETPHDFESLQSSGRYSMRSPDGLRAVVGPEIRPPQLAPDI
jgi:hypothetical protein